MVSAFKESMKSASKIVNSVLGDLCCYQHTTGDITPDVHITIDRNKKVTDDFGTLVGYRVEATILKGEISTVKNQDEFTDASGNNWQITEITLETSAKWYVSIIQQ